MSVELRTSPFNRSQFRPLGPDEWDAARFRLAVGDHDSSFYDPHPLAIGEIVIVSDDDHIPLCTGRIVDILVETEQSQVDRGSDEPGYAYRIAYPQFGSEWVWHEEIDGLNSGYSTGQAEEDPEWAEAVHAGREGRIVWVRWWYRWEVLLRLRGPNVRWL